MKKADRKHCKNGHEYTEENTRYKTNLRNGNLMRVCRICSRLSGRRRIGNFNEDIAPIPHQRKTFCKHGHELTSDNVLSTVEWSCGKPYEHRHCRQCARERHKRITSFPTEKRVRELLSAVQEGSTISQVLGRTKTPLSGKIINHHDWKALKYQAPKLAKKIKLLSHKNEAVNRTGYRTKMFQRSERHSDAEVMALANSIVPRGINHDDRQDIIARMMLAYLEGELPVKKMRERWHVYRAAHTKFFNPQFNPLAHRSQRHLPMFSMESTMLFAGENDGVALGTTVSQGMWQGQLTPEDILLARET